MTEDGGRRLNQQRAPFATLAERLEDLELRYSVMVEQAPEAIVVFDLDDGYFVEVNQRACHLYGKTRDELLWKETPLSLSPTRQPNGRLSAELVPEYLNRSMAGETPRFEWVHLRGSCEEVLCRIQLARVPSKGRRLVRASMVDISDQKAAEQERKFLRAVVEATPDLIGMAKTNGDFLYMNPAARRRIEVPDDEDVTNLVVHEIHTESSTRLLLEVAIPTAIREGVWRGETEVVTRNGNVFPTSHVLIAHKNDHGDVEYVSTIARDITEQLANARLQREMMRRQKLESLGVLAGGIAHDFNNILVGVLGNAALLAKRATRPEDQDLAREIQNAATRASDLAGQMLAYVGKAQVTWNLVHLDELASDVASLVASSFIEGAKMRFDFCGDLPPVAGDSAQLAQVLMNIILNGVEALGGEPGSVTVRTILGPIDRRQLIHDHLPEGLEEGVTLEVSDTGNGMPKPVIDRIFDPFFTTKFTGRGLGLAAVLGIVRGHKGAIAVESEPGRHTVFRLFFPAAEGLAPIATEARPEIAPAPSHGTILVVDDEGMVRRVMRAVLEDAGFDVLEADGGKEALELFERHEAGVRAAVVDVTMPDMSGPEVIKRLRAIRADLPIVMSSGYASVSVPCVEADRFLQKPFHPTELVESIREVMRTAGGRLM